MGYVSMKDLIIGGCYGYDYDQIKFWINSINKHFNGDKVLIIANCPEDLKKQVEDDGFTVITYGYNDDVAPHVFRFATIHDYLYKIGIQYRYVITTDVRDVVFQSDPAKWLENNLGSYKFVAGTECLIYMHEPWGDNNLFETYGPYMHHKFRDKEIFNVGVLGGTQQAIMDVCLNIMMNTPGRPIKICDQAVFNTLVHSSLLDDVAFKAKLKDLWSANLGTLADQNKMYYFTPNLLEQPPSFDGNHVLVDGQPVCIVHQYDRTPWRQAIESLYT